MGDHAAEMFAAVSAEHCIVAGAAYFASVRHIDALLAEYGYERDGRVSWERYGDDSTSLALVPAYDHDLDAIVTVAVMGPELYRDCCVALERAADVAGRVA